MKEIPLAEQPECGCFTKNEKQLVIGVLDNGIYVYNIQDDYINPNLIRKFPTVQLPQTLFQLRSNAVLAGLQKGYMMIIKDLVTNDEVFQLPCETQKAHVNKIEATTVSGRYAVATNYGVFLIGVTLEKMQIQVLKTFLIGISVDSLAFIEARKILITSTKEKKILILDTRSGEIA